MPSLVTLSAEKSSTEKSRCGIDPSVGHEGDAMKKVTETRTKRDGVITFS
jgi:hypothetical protein